MLYYYRRRETKSAAPTLFILLYSSVLLSSACSIPWTLDAVPSFQVLVDRRGPFQISTYPCLVHSAHSSVGSICTSASLPNHVRPCRHIRQQGGTDTVVDEIENELIDRVARLVPPKWTCAIAAPNSTAVEVTFSFAVFRVFSSGTAAAVATDTSHQPLSIRVGKISQIVWQCLRLDYVLETESYDTIDAFSTTWCPWIHLFAWPYFSLSTFVISMFFFCTLPFFQWFSLWIICCVVRGVPRSHVFLHPVSFFLCHFVLTHLTFVLCVSLLLRMISRFVYRTIFEVANRDFCYLKLLFAP